jgi:hypothetical protein
MKHYTYLFLLAILFFNCSSEDDGNENPNNIDPGPFSVTILETRMDGASIEWTEAIDIDDDTVTYTIYLNDQLISTGGISLSYNFTGLDPETLYDGYILADDGNGGTSEAAFFFVTEPEVVISSIEPTYWINDSFPEAGGTRFIYGNGFLVPRDENATSYQLEVIDYRFDNFPYDVGNVYNWTNDAQNSVDVTYDEATNQFRIQLTGVSVNTVNPDYDDFFNNVTGVTGEGELIITFGDN